MSVNFFNAACSESATTADLFGICDDQNNTKAYTDIESPKKWIAVVKNNNAVEITFIAIDNCSIVLQNGQKDQESTCDGMLTFSDSLYLVELKGQMTGGWLSRSIEQLGNTMKILVAAHDLKAYRYKKAFACNDEHKHKRFNTDDNERNKWFFKTYGFRFEFKREIVIK